MQVAEVNIQRFKDWFFGRVPAYDFDEEIQSDTIYVNSESDLPRDGVEEVNYTVADTGDTFQFKDGAYHAVSPYVFGVDECYRDKPRVIHIKETITDHSYEIPSLNAEQVKSGASPSLAALYNVIALRMDLTQIRSRHVTGYRTTLMEYLGKGPHKDSEKNVTEWFRREHTLLYRLLVSSHPSQTTYSREVIDALFHHGYVLTWDKVKNKAMFKLEDLTVYL